MPKVSNRRTLEPRTHCHQATIMSGARKVSFEDSEVSSFPSSSQLSSSNSTSSGSLHRSSCSRNLKPKVLMRRPTPSVCLADMVDMDESEHGSCVESPLSTRNSEDSSQWGHFIDVIPTTPEEEGEDYSDLWRSPNATLLSSSPYSYQPYFKPKRMALRKNTSNTFLPGFFLITPAEASTEDHVMGALKRMHV